MSAMQKRLPKGWRMAMLGEVCELVRGVTYEKREASNVAEKTYVPILRANNITSELNFENLVYVPSKRISVKQYIRKDDIIIAMSSGSKDVVGKAAQAKFDFHGAFGAFCGLIRPSDEINKRFVGFFFQSFFYRDTVSRLSIGVNINNLRREHIESLAIPLPPLPTQRKIAGILEEADSLRKLRRQADEKMQDLIPSLFVQMFGDPATNPKGWEKTKLSDIAEFKRGPFGGSLKKEIFVKEGYKVYEQKNAIYNKFSIGNYCIDEKKYKEMIDFAINIDDLIISCSGTIGKIAIVPKDAKEGIINQALLKITPNQKHISSLVLKMFIESESVQNGYFRNTAGSAMQNVTSVKELKKLQIPLPPLPLQRKFAAHVKEIEAEKARQAESKTKLDELFNSLMSRAFTGELAA